MNIRRFEYLFWGISDSSPALASRGRRKRHNKKDVSKYCKSCCCCYCNVLTSLLVYNVILTNKNKNIGALKHKLIFCSAKALHECTTMSYLKKTSWTSYALDGGRSLNPCLPWRNDGPLLPVLCSCVHFRERDYSIPKPEKADGGMVLPVVYKFLSLSLSLSHPIYIYIYIYN